MNQGQSMRIRATLQLRNDIMLQARKDHGLTQTSLAQLAVVPIWLVSALERLQFPDKYRYEQARRIADVLEINVDNVLPEKMVGWKGQTKFQYTQEIPVERLLEYKDTQERHYLLPSPDEEAQYDENMARVRIMVDNLSYREREIIKLRYGLGEDRMCYTYEEIGRIFKVERARVHQIEARAIRKLTRMAGRADVMSAVGKLALTEMENEREREIKEVEQI